MKNNKKSLVSIVSVGLMAALVFVGSTISIPIPTVLDVSRIHLGNIFCLLAGFLLGGWKGGLAAGIGSMLYDFTNPHYIASAPITFVNKFLMAFVTGSISTFIYRRERKRGVKTGMLFAAAGAGALTYVALYLTKSFVTDIFFLRTEVATAVIDIQIKSVTSLFNAAVATLLSVPLSVTLRAGVARALKKKG